MKNRIVKIFCFCSGILLLASCGTASRFGKVTTLQKPPETAQQINLTRLQAEKILKDAFANPPAGRRRKNVDFEFIRKYVKKIQIRKHNRSEYYLVEFFTDNRKYVSFYVRDEAAARKVANAVWTITAAKKAPK